MIIGLFLAVTLSISITSLIVIFTSNTGILRENMATGAVIGTAQASSYAFITFIISLIATFALILILKNKQN